MKVLWIVNLIPSNVSAAMGTAKSVLGGWVESMAGQLSLRNDIQLAVACKNEGSEQFFYQLDRVNYYGVAYNSKTSVDEIKKRCLQIIDDFCPELIQIEGTEFLHALAMLGAAKERNIKTVVSLQGILNGQYNYQCGQLQIPDMMFSLSFTNIYSAWVMYLRQRCWYKKRLAPERKILEQADNFMGRTVWDRAHSYSINPSAGYYTCNRVLRPPFYEKKWDVKNIERHSIYIGNGYFPLKGLHFVLMALPQLIREYPDVKVYVGGYKPFEEHDRRSPLKKGYAAYLKKLIRDLDIAGHVVLLGPLSAQQVADRLEKSHVYVLCSTVENSPNTLGEAMVIGTPCVSAYVGGVADMADDGTEVLFYRNDDPAFLAWNIKRIFDYDQFANKLSQKAKIHALETHDAKKNAEKLISVYNEILKR